jgi:hypothetical protein
MHRSIQPLNLEKETTEYDRIHLKYIRALKTLRLLVSIILYRVVRNCINLVNSEDLSKVDRITNK